MLPLREYLITEGKQGDSGNMAIMLSGPDPFPPAVTLLDSVNPYGSRRLTVEFDGTTTAAYLRDETTVHRRHLDSQPCPRAAHY